MLGYIDMCHIEQRHLDKVSAMWRAESIALRVASKEWSPPSEGQDAHCSQILSFLFAMQRCCKDRAADAGKQAEQWQTKVLQPELSHRVCKEAAGGLFWHQQPSTLGQCRELCADRRDCCQAVSPFHLTCHYLWASSTLVRLEVDTLKHPDVQPWRGYLLSTLQYCTLFRHA